MSLVQMFKENVISTEMSLVQMFKENVISTVQYILFLFYVDPLLD